MTDADRRHQEAWVDAAARGEPRAALEHYLAGLVVEGTTTRAKLSELARLVDQAPGWMYSRWAVDQAFLWMLFNEDPRVEQAVRQMMYVSHWDAVVDAVDDETGVALTELGTLIAAGDQLCQQLAVFDYGGLRDFLETKAEPQLLARCDSIAEWTEARLGGFVLRRMKGPMIELEDLADGTTHRVLNLGAMHACLPGDAVIARLVPAAIEPGWMFASRPIEVDRRTAELVAAEVDAAEPDAWVPPVGDAVSAARLTEAFSCGSSWSYFTDLYAPGRSREGEAADPPWLKKRIGLLMADGLDEPQSRAVLLAEDLLGPVLVEPEAAGRYAPIMSTLVLVPGFFDAMASHCTEPEYRDAWCEIAAAVPEPARTLCAELARLSSP